MQVTVKENQSLMDIAVQYCGTAECAHEIAMQNNLNPSESLCVGQILQVAKITSKDIANYFTINRLFPATGNAGLLGGINYMEVETDFKIS